jgi:hypothetical protein
MRDAVLSFALTIAMCSDVATGLSAVRSRSCTSSAGCFVGPLRGSIKMTCLGIAYYESRSRRFSLSDHIL